MAIALIARFCFQPDVVEASPAIQAGWFPFTDRRKSHANGEEAENIQDFAGFFDLAIAAPSMKAALEAWGAGSNLFHQGIANETDDPETVAATMAKPGVVLKRPAGSNRRFAEHSDLPTDLGSDRARGSHGKSRSKPKKRGPSNISEEASREAGSGVRAGAKAARCGALARTGRERERTRTTRQSGRKGAGDAGESRT
jgi:hypothetical protein